jgi:hypothetical protein
MWGFWSLVFLFQMVRGKSWIDLLVVVGVFSILLLMLTVFVPGWVIIDLIIVGHMAILARALISNIKRKKKVPPCATLHK